MTEKGIKKWSTPSQVRADYGTPYSASTETNQDAFRIGKEYVSMTYDKHQNNTLMSLLVIDKNHYRSHTAGLRVSAAKRASLAMTYERQILDITNSYRYQSGVGILQAHTQIQEVARAHNLDMANLNYFSHTGADGSTLGDRVRRKNIGYATIGENLAMGNMNGILAVECWMNSLGHRENLLHPSFTYLGVAGHITEAGYGYYTQNFLLP